MKLEIIPSRLKLGKKMPKIVYPWRKKFSKKYQAIWKKKHYK